MFDVYYLIFFNFRYYDDCIDNLILYHIMYSPGVEMSSTGEVACFGSDVQEAFLQALLSTNFKLPLLSKDKYILISFAEDK